MIDKELFELCKQVYEVTWWDRYHNGHIEQYIEKAYFTIDGILQDSVVDRYKLLKEQFVCPLYTSDYLLEKLPESILLDKQYKRWLSMDNLGSDGWQFSYRAERTAPLYASVSETPLKALLKLTLALNKAGVEL